MAEDNSCGYDFFVRIRCCLGIDGANLVNTREPFTDVIMAGADMYLSEPVQFEQVLLAIEAVHHWVAPLGALKGADCGSKGERRC